MELVNLNFKYPITEDYDLIKDLYFIFLKTTYRLML